MNDGTGRVPCLIVGISRAPASWWALAWAVGEARRRGARLLLVHVFRPVAAPVAGADLSMPPTSRDLYAEGVAYSNALIRTAIDHAVGWMPRDVAIEQETFSGRPAVELARLARGGDLLVLGSRRRRWLRRLAPGSVARACARRADCPVVIVPEPSPKRLRASLPVPARVPRLRWVPRRGARTAS